MRALVVAAGLLMMPVLAEAAGGEDVLKGLREEHPRVLLTKESLAEIRRDAKVAGSPRETIAKAVIARADKLLGDPKDRVSYTIVGPRLLTESRRNLQNIMTLSMAYLLTDERKYADLAIDQMQVAGKFQDWNQRHFLDTAEMTTALGLGYDWLYPVLTEAQREEIRRAIVRHGLEKGREAYGQDGSRASFGWWIKATHNWSQVCNGGLAVGALAVGKDGDDATDELCRFVVASGLERVKGAYAHWDKDGGWDEGPGYWGYTIAYTVFHMAALESATGSMHGLEKTPGLDNAGRFRMHFIGPMGKTFNFADAGDSAGGSPQMFFMGQIFNRPEYILHRRQEKPTSTLDLIWDNGKGEAGDMSKVDPNALFRGVNVAFFRTDWTANATWVGVKGGDNAANHSHLDLGTYVMDAMGKRWVLDLGSDEYNMPGYFGPQRWTYYRLKTEGHNTVVIGEENQPNKAKAEIVAFDAKGRTAVIDLSEGYPKAKRVRRGVAMMDVKGGPAVVVQDEIEGAGEEKVATLIHTPAKVEIEAGGKSAKLTQGDKVMKVEVLAGGTLRAAPVELAPPQKPGHGESRIVLGAEGKGEMVRLVYRIAPVGAGEVKVRPLEEWEGMKK